MNHSEVRTIMHSTLNSSPSISPRCTKKWNHRKCGMTKHKKSKKERRVISKELRALKSEVNEIGSEKCETHIERLKQININQPTKRNGSAKTMRNRHPKRATKKLPFGHSGWKTVHETLLY